jgi:hypothetical protein
LTNITEIRGVVFRSQKEAAQWAGVSPSAISTRLSHTGTLERVGLNMAGGQIGNQARAKPLTLGKTTFPSRTIAAQEIGITRDKLTRALSPKATTAMKERLLLTIMRYEALKANHQGIKV